MDRREAALERFERATELLLLVLALVMVPLLVLPLLVQLPLRLERSLVVVDWFIWAAFAFEYVVRLVLSPRRWLFVRRQWPDLLIILLPFLRPLRVARSREHFDCYASAGWSPFWRRRASRGDACWSDTASTTPSSSPWWRWWALPLSRWPSRKADPVVSTPLATRCGGR